MQNDQKGAADRLEREERKKLGWYNWLSRDMSILFAQSAPVAGLIFQTVLRGIVSWGFARYGRTKTPKERFIAICKKELRLHTCFANLLYDCKRAYDEVGIWPIEIALAATTKPILTWLEANQESGRALAINVVMLGARLMAVLERQLPQKHNGKFNYTVMHLAGEKVINVMEFINKGGEVIGDSEVNKPDSHDDNN
jgi:hypothetical protein